jgi:hypothetical protein
MIRSRVLTWTAVGVAMTIGAGELATGLAQAASGYLTACCSQTATLSLDYGVGSFSWSTQGTPNLHYHRVWNGSGVLIFNSYTSVSAGWAAGGCACYREAGIKRDGAASVTDLVYQL